MRPSPEAIKAGGNALRKLPPQDSQFLLIHPALASGKSIGATVLWSSLVLTPIILLGLLLLPDMQNQIRPLQQDAIDQRANKYGIGMLERLADAENILRLTAAEIESHGIRSLPPNLPTLDSFSRVVVQYDLDTTTVIKGGWQETVSIDESSAARLAQGLPTLIVRAVNGKARLILVSPIRAVDVNSRGLVIAELDSSYVWPNISHTNSVERFCVVNRHNQPLSCDPEIASSLASPGSALLASTIQDASGLSRTVDNDGLTGTVRLPVKALFGGEDWVVLSRQTVSTASTSVNRWALIYMATGIFCVVISILFGSLLQRRAAAKSASSDIGKPENSTQLRSRNSAYTTTDNDLRPNAATGEYQSRLDNALRILANIDRAILSGASFERIVDSFVHSVPDVLPADFLAVALLDHDRPTQCSMIVTGLGIDGQTFGIEGALDSKSLASIAVTPDGEWMECSPDDALLKPLHSLGARHCLLIPVYKDGQPVAMLILARREMHAEQDNNRALARDFADRLGVAYTSATRGEELQFHSLFDSTTELPNRKFFERRLEEEISRARRESQQVALLFIDLDNFKTVNDNFGHEGGDALLEQVSLRLKHSLRKEDLVARFSGDEFAVLLPTIAKSRDAARVAEKLIESLSQSYSIGGREHHTTATIGIAVYPEDGKTQNALMRSADFAMHAAKKEGGAQYANYEPRASAQEQDQAALASDLRKAIARSELTLYFQPQIDLRSNEIVGAEALVRWNHQTRGMVMPMAFISIAEQSDLIEHLGEFVRREASSQFRVWESEGVAPPRVSVNVSSREFRRKDFLEMVEKTLETSGLRPFSLELEITESLLVDNSDHVLSVLKALSARGVRIAIDDFGTGYSSMAYLKNLPFEVLKIDRSFVKDIGTQDGSDSIVDAIIGMAQGLGKEIVAEGIETEGQRAFLAKAGCEMGQGYLWSPPVPADEFATFIRNWNMTARHVASIS